MNFEMEVIIKAAVKMIADAVAESCQESQEILTPSKVENLLEIVRSKLSPQLYGIFHAHSGKDYQQEVLHRNCESIVFGEYMRKQGKIDAIKSYRLVMKDNFGNIPKLADAKFQTERIIIKGKVMMMIIADMVVEVSDVKKIAEEINRVLSTPEATEILSEAFRQVEMNNQYVIGKNNETRN